MQIGLLFFIYILNALIVALILLWAFLSDRSTANNHRMSWLIVFIASALWFVAIPLSLAEVLRRAFQQRRAVSTKAVSQDIWAKK